jgi:acyl-CoA reductase-like NAD-dependent aldehyde dehydrogenase
MTMTLDAPGIDILAAVRRFAGETGRLLIDGSFVDAAEGGTFETLDPATGERITDVAAATEVDVDRAVTAARRALQGEWGALSATARGRMLARLADAVEVHAEELAQLESLDNGKPVAFARYDMQSVADHFRYFAGWSNKIEGATIPTAVPQTLVYTRPRPVGVVAAIVPWNFPLLMASWKMAPALAAGCTVVLKPAEQTPLSALRFGELALEAGLPAGALNIVTGYGETTGRALVDHPDVDKIAFTGSTAVGKEIAAVAARTVKSVSLELGGKSPHIVLEDTDLEAAAATAANAIFYESGQVCSAGSRLMVQSSVYDELVERITTAAGALKMGPGLAPGTTLGPLVSAEQLERVASYVEGGLADGASATIGGARGDGGGYFFGPTVLTNVPDAMTVCREEIFGPVLVTQSFETLEEVARRANATEYGLAAGIWTRDLGKAHRLADLLEAGSVYINCYNSFDAAVPFGGFKQSGYGRDGGRAALDKFLDTKAVWTNLM